MKKVLIIEDNEDIRNNTAEILELSHYEVIVAENGKIGVEKALEHSPDLIICDIMMPVLDGYGVLHAIQKNDAIKNTPFIFLTAKSERGDFRKGMELGADDYLTKPFDGTELLKAVDGRLKKIELLKSDFSSDLQGLANLVEATSGRNILQTLTDERNANVYKKKQIVYSNGNRPNRLYYVIKGKVKAFRANEDGKELVTDLYSAGDFFGYSSLLENIPYKDTTEALEDSEIAVIPKEEFDDLMNRNPEVAKKFIQLLARNVGSKEDQLLGMAYNSLRKKVADALLVLQRKYHENKSEQFVIELSRENLATIAGTATESLVRTLSDFKNEKMIDIVGGKIVILNQKKLENLLN
jgi:CRP-like cAMP-binding protein/ActR/RegA family two-component response regulator